MDEVPPLLPTLNPRAPAVAKQAVLAQLAQDPTDEHFPLLIYEGQIISDFTLTTRFKTVKGVEERMAGIAFRIQNPTNYYVVRASSLGNNLRFYKVSNGQRGPLVGPDVPVPSGVWHDLTIECKGNTIRCLFNGKELITATDKINPFTSGKIGFWTKSDSVSYFADARLVYKPHEAPAQGLVRDMLKKYPRLLGLQVYVLGDDPKTPRLVASKNTNEVNRVGGQSRTGRYRAGHALLREGKGFRFRGAAAAGPQRGFGRRRARHHEDLCGANGAERFRARDAGRPGNAEPVQFAAGPGAVVGSPVSRLALPASLIIL